MGRVTSGFEWNLINKTKMWASLWLEWIFFYYRITKKIQRIAGSVFKSHHVICFLSFVPCYLNFLKRRETVALSALFSDRLGQTCKFIQFSFFFWFKLKCCRLVIKYRLKIWDIKCLIPFVIWRSRQLLKKKKERDAQYRKLFVFAVTCWTQLKLLTREAQKKNTFWMCMFILYKLCFWKGSLQYYIRFIYRQKYNFTW